MSVIFLLITKLKALGLESDLPSASSFRHTPSGGVSSPPMTPKGKIAGASDGGDSSSTSPGDHSARVTPRSPRHGFGAHAGDASHAYGANAANTSGATGSGSHVNAPGIKPVGEKPRLTIGGAAANQAAHNAAVASQASNNANKKRPTVPPRMKSVSSNGDLSVQSGMVSNSNIAISGATSGQQTPTATQAAARVTEDIPTDPEERKKYLAVRLQSSARAYLARKKMNRIFKEQREVVARLSSSAGSQDLAKVIRLQATVRGMLTRNLPVLRLRRKRNEIANEIFRTEDTYVSQLQVLVEVYMGGLEELGDAVIPAAKLRSIFSDVKVILAYNGVILKMLTERMATWYQRGQTVGDIFGKLADFLKTYTAYVNNYNESMNVLQDQMMNNSAFANKINDCRANPKVKGMEITSFLIMPIQRLPRYVMLLSDLFKNTPQTHADYEPLQGALKKVEGVASYVNTKKREAENLLGVTTVARHLVGLESMAEFTQPHRRYVRQGFLQEAEPTSISLKSLKTRYFFAFNDILVCTKESTGVLSKSKIPTNGFDIDGLRDSDAQFKYLYRFPLLGALINELPEQNKVTNMFELVESPTPLVIQSVVAATSSSQQNGSSSSSSSNNNAQQGGSSGASGSDAPNNSGGSSGTSSTASSSQANSASPKKLILVAPSQQTKDEWIHDLDEIVMTCLEKHRSRIGVTPSEERTELPADMRTPTFTGILHKRSESGDWKKNYFVLCQDVLMYYPNVASGVNPDQVVTPKKIPLILASVMSVPLMDRSYSMRLFTKERVYVLSADTAHERMQWVNTIRAAIAKRLVEIEAKQRAQNEAAMQAHVAATAPAQTTLIGGSLKNATSTEANSTSTTSTTPSSTKVSSSKKHKEKNGGDNAHASESGADHSGTNGTSSSKDPSALGVIGMAASGNSTATRESPRSRSHSSTPAGSEKKSRKKDKEKSATIGKVGKSKTLSSATASAAAAELKANSSSSNGEESGSPRTSGTEDNEAGEKKGSNKHSKQSSPGSSKKEEKDKKSTLRKKKKADAAAAAAEVHKIAKTGEVYKFSSGSEKVAKQKMTLTDGILKLYKSGKSKAVGSIDLLLVQPISSNIESTTVKDATVHQFTLITPERKYVFGTDSEEEAQSWIETIQLAHEALGR